MALHSKIRRLVQVAAITALSGALLPATIHAPAASADQLTAGPAMGIVWAMGNASHSMGTSDTSFAISTPKMTYHGGVIMPIANVYPIFWGKSWPSYRGDEMTGIDSFYAGWSNSNYAKTSDEYTGSNGQVGPASSSRTHAVDGSAATNGSATSSILAEVAKAINSGLVPLDTSGNGYYPVYTDVPRGSAGFCSWHNSGSVNGQRVEFAFFFKLDGDFACDPGDTTTGHSQGLAALANVSGVALSEARTDPAFGGWYDSSNQEDAAKCAWTFNVPSVTFSNGTKWKMQGEWSNAAYTARTGYPNSSGLRGCLDGH